jgi:ABC-type cobalamin/Fe3+-siderophores transport system ATPase subunit
MLEIRHLDYQIGSHRILKDICTSFPEHTVTGIVGPNGSGKSTLLAHICRLHPSTNKIFLHNLPVESISPRLYARQVAVLSQQRDNLASELLAHDVVLMGRYPYKERFSDYTAQDRAIAQEIIERTGLVPLADTKIGYMSGGEKQRVFIAKTLAQEPEILLLDEPTNHLDVKYKLALMQELRRFNGTVAIVLHDLSLAARFCDRAIVMENGSIVAQGETKEVLTAERLQQVFEVPFHAIEQDGTYYLYY